MVVAVDISMAETYMIISLAPEQTQKISEDYLQDPFFNKVLKELRDIPILQNNPCSLRIAMDFSTLKIGMAIIDCASLRVNRLDI